MRLRYDDLDVFRLDIIARELKVIDKTLAGVTGGAGAIPNGLWPMMYVLAPSYPQVK